MFSIPVSFSLGVHPSFKLRARERTFAALAIIVAAVTTSCASSGAARKPRTGEKLAITAAERAIIVDAAIKERRDTMDELEIMVDELIERSAVKVVDHFFMRAVQLLAIALVGMGLIAVVVVVLWRRRPPYA